MARFYGKKILAGKMQIADVPMLWRKQTEIWLRSNGEVI